jgi:hypothetical protein
VPLSPGSFSMTGNGKHAKVHAKNVPVLDTFVFGGSDIVPATVDFKVRWDAIGPPADLGSGGAVEPTDPAAFLGTFAPARAEGSFSGWVMGFDFTSDPGASSDVGYAELGTERNGVFLP